MQRAMPGKARRSREQEYERDRNERPCDGAEDAVEALGENETAVRLGDDEHRQKRPFGFIEFEPERKKKREKNRRAGLERERKGDERATFSRNNRDRDFGPLRLAHPRA